MKTIRTLTFTLLALSSLLAFTPQPHATSEVRAASPAGQTPQGLAKSDWAGIRAAYEAGRHAFQPVAGQDGVLHARIPGQQWTTKFDGRGFVSAPKDGGWQWGLELQRYGFPGAERDIQHAIREMINQGCNLVLTTGGTGVALRDVTPEAVREIAIRGDCSIGIDKCGGLGRLGA